MNDGSDERKDEEDRTGNRYVTFKVNVQMWNRFVALYPGVRPGDRFRNWVTSSVANAPAETSNVG